MAALAAMVTVNELLDGHVGRVCSAWTGSTSTAMWSAFLFPDCGSNRVHSGKGESVVARKYEKYSPEYREEAAKLVVETSRPIADVARELGVGETTLGNWVRTYREAHAAEPELPISKRARLRELERRTPVNSRWKTHS
jgi:transposase